MRARELPFVVACSAAVAALAWGILRTGSSQLLPPAIPSAAPAASGHRDCLAYEGLYLDFAFPDRESPWQRGRRYQLELSLDGEWQRCDFEVPPAPPPEMQLPPACTPDFDGRGEPRGLRISGSPARIGVRVLSQGKVFYAGAIETRLAPPGETCGYRRIELGTVEPVW